MAVIDFTGIGQVEVPDDITDEQIQELGDMLSKGRVRSAAASAGRSLQAGVGQAVSGARRAAQKLATPTQIPIGMGGFGMRDQTAQNLSEINRGIAQEQALQPEQDRLALLESPTYQFGRELTSSASEVFQPNPLYKGDFFTDTVASGAGNLPPLLAAGAVGGPLAAGLVYGAQAGEATAQESDAILDQRIAEAQQAGDTNLASRLERAKFATSQEAFAAGATIGAVTEATLGVAGRVVPALRNATQLAGRNFATKAVQGAVREAAQEGSEQLLGNVAAQQIYDPNRLTLEGVGEAAAAGAVLGGGMAAGVETFRPRLTEAKTQQVVNDLVPTSPNTALTLELMQDGLTVAQRSQSSPTRRLEAPAIDVEATPVQQPLPESRQLTVSPETGMVLDETGQPATFTQPQPTTPDAIQEQSPTESVLREGQPQVELQGVGTENAQVQQPSGIPTPTQEEVTPEAQARIEPEPSVSEEVPPVTSSERIRDDLSQAENDLRNLGVTPQSNAEAVGRYLKAGAKMAWDKVAAGFKRNFTSKGDLPDSVFQETIKRTGKIKAMEQEGKYIARDYNRVLREVYGLNRAGQETNLQQVPKEDIQKFNAYLTKEDNGATIDPRVREQLDKMRDYLDNLSNELVRRGLVDSKLEKIVTDNLGVYLTRSYRFFDDPKWAENIPKERLNTARSYILSEMQRSNPAATVEDADRQVRNMIEDWKKEGVDSFIRGGKLGSKDMYTFFKRKDIAPEIRALLGEYKDPQVNFTRSVAKIARYIGDQEFLTKVKQDGMGTFLFEANQAPAGFNTQIATEGSKMMEPLNGLRTSPEIARVFEEYGKRDNVGGIWKSIMAINALTKTAATVGSVQTQMRNLWGQIYFNTLNGDFRLNNYGKSAKSVLADLGALSDPEWRKRYANYLRLGVVGDSTISGEIRESVKAVFNRDMPEDDFSFRALGHFIKKYGLDKPAEIYQAADDLGKIAAFESRKADVKAINPTWSEKQVEEQAAREIREDYPTHQMASKAVRAFRRQPFLGSFATFNAEMMRSTYNSLRRTMDYLHNNEGNPAKREIGIRRAVGAMSALGGASFALAVLGRLLTGMTAEDDEDVRKFLPPYEKNSNLIYLGRSEDGKVRYIDESRFNPYAMFGDATRAMFSNDEKGIQSALWEGLVELTGGYADESLILSKVADVNRNKTESGRKVYNDEATTGDKLYESAKHVGEVLVPGTAKRAVTRLLPAVTGTENRRGVVPSLPAELAREGLGVAIEDIDFERALEFRARDFPKRISESTSIFTSELYKRGEKDPQKVLDAYQAQENARLGIWTDLYNQASAAIRQGVPRDEVQSILESNGVGKRDARLILNGSYRAYRPSKEVLERAKDRNRVIPTTELDALATERDALRLSDELPPVEPQAPGQWPVF